MTSNDNAENRKSTCWFGLQMYSGEVSGQLHKARLCCFEYDLLKKVVLSQKINILLLEYIIFGWNIRYES